MSTICTVKTKGFVLSSRRIPWIECVALSSETPLGIEPLITLST